MNDDLNNLTLAIDESPLSEDDKNHWRMLLPKMDDEQKKRLRHSLSVKTQAAKAISLIEKALKIIDEAEAEVQEEEPPKTKPSPRQSKDMVMQELEQNPGNQPEKTTITQEDLHKMREDEQKRLEEMRQELKNLSQETHGQSPPSYQD